MRAAAIVLAAGSGSRLAAGKPKALASLGGAPLFVWSLETLAAVPGVDRLVLVVPAATPSTDAAVAVPALGVECRVVPGGARRRDSVFAGLGAAGDVDHVLVHDAARCLVTPTLADRVLTAARTHGAAIPVLPVGDTLIRDAGGRAGDEVARDDLRAVQTPQGFARTLLERAHREAPPDWDARDDGSMVRRLGQSVALVEGDRDNWKVTYPGDLARAERILEARGGGEEARIGCGWDVHPLVAGRRFVLVGIELVSDRGPMGHSDGDPLAHAIADALLGAAALGDIGQHFPDTDPRFKDLSGTTLLSETLAILARHGIVPLQVDAVVVTDLPKIAPQRDAIRAALAKVLQLPLDRVSLKGKRTEGLGGLAGGAGVSCQAIALARRIRRA